MIWGKSKIRVILVSVSVQIHFGIDFLSGDKDVLSLVYGGHLSPEKFYALFLGRKGQVHLLFLKHLPFKIVNVPKYHIWGVACPEFSPPNTCFLSGHLQKLLISCSQVL